MDASRPAKIWPNHLLLRVDYTAYARPFIYSFIQDLKKELNLLCFLMYVANFLLLLSQSSTNKLDSERDL